MTGDDDRNPFHTIEDEYERKERHLRLLKESREGDDRRSTHNAIIADNETAFETGHFSSDRKADEHYQYGFIVRGRRDAMAAKLNSGDAVDAINRVEAMLRDRTLFLRPRRGRARLIVDLLNSAVLAFVAYWIASAYGAAPAIGFATLCILVRIEASGRDE